MGTAVITIAHRLATAREADRLHVVEDGRIVETGAPAHLLASGGRFAAPTTLDTAGWDWYNAVDSPRLLN